MKIFFFFLLSVCCFAQEIHRFPVVKDAELVKYTSREGVVRVKDVLYCDTLKVDIFSAPNPKNATALLLIHGGGWVSGDREQLAHLASRMAELGYVCFVPEYRLSGKALYPAAIQDVTAALHWVNANHKAFGIRKSKIVVGGYSAGGQLAALLGSTYHKPIYKTGLCHIKKLAKPAAIVDIDGLLAFIHPESGEGDDTKRLSAATRWFGYPKTFSTLGWLEASPLKHVSAKTPPTLFINSSVKRMHAGREDYLAVLNQKGIYSEVHEFENAPHDFCTREPWFEKTVEIMDAFLKRVKKL
jgi:acetyl esterase/lipase